MSKLLVDDIRKFMTEGLGVELNEKSSQNKMDLGKLSKNMPHGKITKQHGVTAFTAKGIKSSDDNWFDVQIFKDGNCTIVSDSKAPLDIHIEGDFTNSYEELSDFISNVKSDAMSLNQMKGLKKYANDEFSDLLHKIKTMVKNAISIKKALTTASVFIGKNAEWEE
jgi:hypothetical protein